jgi:hypothetical protein
VTPEYAPWWGCPWREASVCGIGLGREGFMAQLEEWAIGKI